MPIHTHTEYIYKCDMCKKTSNKVPPDILKIFSICCLDSLIELNLKIDFYYEWMPGAVICNDCVIKYLKEFIAKQEQENGK